MNKIKVEVRSQAELNACVQAGNIAVVVGCRVVALENSSVVALGNSRVVALENSSVEARGNSSVVALGNSSVEARGNSSVVARGNSSVEAWENSSVEARGNSSVVARGNVFVRWFSALKIKASFAVIVGKMGEPRGVLEGGRILDCKGPTTPAEWCDHHGVEVKDGVAILYKGVNREFMSDRGVCYAPTTIPVALDWDGGNCECGGGLHYSPTPNMTLEFAQSATKWVACPVAISDMRPPHQNDQYPNKIKARGCCAPVWEVTKKGERVQNSEDIR